MENTGQLKGGQPLNPSCGMEVTECTDLPEHIRQLTGRKLQNSSCMDMAISNELREHVQAENSQSPSCSMEVAKPNDFNDHISSMKVQKLQNPSCSMEGKTFKCSTCGQAFNRASDLGAHVKLHTGEGTIEDSCGSKDNYKLSVFSEYTKTKNRQKYIVMYMV